MKRRIKLVLLQRTSNLSGLFTQVLDTLTHARDLGLGCLAFRHDGLQLSLSVVQLQACLAQAKRNGQKLCNALKAGFYWRKLWFGFLEIFSPAVHVFGSCIRVFALENAFDRLDLSILFFGDFVGPLHHARVNIEIQKVGQNFPAVLRPALQKKVELSLWQDHRFRETVEIKTNDLLDERLRFLYSVRQG